VFTLNFARLALAGILLCFNMPVQKAENEIVLHDEKLNFIPSEFYIAGVAITALIKMT
jgi:hypothetical protein